MERLNQWLMLIANVGVVAGIVFLAYEVRVNTHALSTATSTSYLENWIQSLAASATDPDLTALFETAATKGWDAVPLEKRGRVISWRISQLKAAEFAHFQWSEGLLDDRLWASNDVGTYDYFWSWPDAMEVYEGTRHLYYEAFQQYADEMIADICSRKTCRSETFFGPPNGDLLKAREAWAGRGD